MSRANNGGGNPYRDMRNGQFTTKAGASAGAARAAGKAVTSSTEAKTDAEYRAKWDERVAANKAEIEARRKRDTELAVANGEAVKRMMFGPGGSSPRGVNAENVGTYIEAAQKEADRAAAHAADKKYAPGYRKGMKAKAAHQQRLIAAMKKQFPEAAGNTSNMIPKSEPDPAYEAQLREKWAAEKVKEQARRDELDASMKRSAEVTNRGIANRARISGIGDKSVEVSFTDSKNRAKRAESGAGESFEESARAILAGKGGTIGALQGALAEMGLGKSDRAKAVRAAERKNASPPARYFW